MNQELFTRDAELISRTESVVFHLRQSVAPQTSACSCRSHSCRNWTFFSMNTRVHFAAAPSSCKTFTFHPVFFLFLFQKMKKRPPLYIKGSSESLGAKILTWKKQRSDPIWIRSRRTCHRAAVFPSGAFDWKEDNDLMSLVRESVV